MVLSRHSCRELLKCARSGAKQLVSLHCSICTLHYTTVHLATYLSAVQDVCTSVFETCFQLVGELSYH
jgi:hypothetical protein